MKIVKMVLVAACVLGSTAATANVASIKSEAKTRKVSIRYYAGRYYTAEATYDVYERYGNGAGSY